MKGDATWRAFAVGTPELFDPRVTKKRYLCDAYFVDLDKRSEVIVDDTRYWFGLFSHQRDTSLWKGMLKIPLCSDDAEASALF